MSDKKPLGKSAAKDNNKKPAISKSTAGTAGKVIKPLRRSCSFFKLVV